MGICCTAIAIIATLLIIFKVWLKWVVAWDRSYTCLVGKTTIVTGANTGIGYYTALDFAKRGARVILACRNKDKAEKAREKIVEASGNQNVVVKLVDFGSLASVRKFAEEINSMEERLDILVNNAGAIGFEHITTDDGLNLYMQSNHFSAFLLTNLLIDLLKKSAPSRIVNVSSIASTWAKLDINNLNAFNDGNTTYANSKLCNVLFTNELARKLKGSGVETNSLHPGFVHTEIGRGLPTFIKLPLTAFAKTLFRTSEEGAQTSIYVAVSKDVQGVSGEYYDNCRVGWLPSMAKAARDEGLAKKLWEKSEEFVKLNAAERQI